jgi:uroporphyrinogen decarboxylase
MNHMERFIATVERKSVDRPASWLGFPVEAAYGNLFRHFNVKNIIDLKLKLDDDIYAVELPYNSPESASITDALRFAKRKANSWDERTLTAPGFFEDYSDPGAINDFEWPEPSKYIDPDKCRKAVADVPQGYAILAALWSAHFQDACAAFGMETALVKMLLEPEMFKTVIDRITEFYLEANEIFYRAVGNKIHAVLLGNDFGSQTGLIISPQQLREFVMPGAKRLIQQAKGHGYKVFYHSCGAIFEVIPDLIEAGVDVIHPIQALAKGMTPDRLKDAYGSVVSFCGGVDAQNLLVNGTPDQVEEKVRELCRIFPTGLVISPSHEAILPDTRPENIESLFNTVKKKQGKHGDGSLASFCK